MNTCELKINKTNNGYIIEIYTPNAAEDTTRYEVYHEALDVLEIVRDWLGVQKK